jgi:hypothetical protein
VASPLAAHLTINLNLTNRCNTSEAQRKGRLMSITKFCRFVFVQAALLSCWLLLIVGPQQTQAQGVDDRACYGDTIEVMLVNQMTSEPKVPLSIPINAFPVVYGYSKTGEEIDPSKSCLAEPVLARSVYFYKNHKQGPGH